MLPRAAFLAAALLQAACGSPAPAPPAATRPAPPRAPPAAPLPPWEVPFTVRGRLQGELVVSWRMDPAGAPLEAARCEAIAHSATEAWTRSGPVRFTPAAADGPADVTIGWRRAADDECHLMGRGLGVAHTGPMGPGTFVHLDAGRPWESDGGEDLDAVLGHELGHVLGLDHSPDPAALMSPDTHATVPQAADIAGLHTLYGGGEDGPGDVWLAAAEPGGGALRSLRCIAPPERTELALLDTDGDGADELLAWRTDPAGLGALMIYRFSPGRPGEGPLLASTRGPWLGIVPPGGRTALRRAADGMRWLLIEEDGVERPRFFDGQGWLREPELQVLMQLDTASLRALPAPPVLPAMDLPRPTDGRPAASLEGDLDGDGRPERVRRGP